MIKPLVKFQHEPLPDLRLSSFVDGHGFVDVDSFEDPPGRFGIKARTLGPDGRVWAVCLRYPDDDVDLRQFTEWARDNAQALAERLVRELAEKEAV